MANGFGFMNEKAELAHLMKENRIVATYDFIYNQTDVSKTSSSGNEQLGLLAAMNPVSYVGLAPKADFVLLRTDMAGQQEPFLETAWVAAMEYADSIGVDIVSSSCIYGVRYDDPQYDRSATQADGSAISSQVADIAFKKGILTAQMFPQRSAGIDFVVPPADARHILSAGNLTRDNTAIWSALNTPTADQRTKPELALLTRSIPIIYGWSDSQSSSNTPPILAGLIACLWQARPQQTAEGIRNILLQSASQAQHPDNKLGFGIPNFKKAYDDQQK